jgi:hypothetical protein
MVSYPHILYPSNIPRDTRRRANLEPMRVKLQATPELSGCLQRGIACMGQDITKNSLDIWAIWDVESVSDK